MGILADFFVATHEEAIRYANCHLESDEGEEIQSLLTPLEYKGFTGLEIGTLWAILEGVEWDVSRHMPESLFLGEENESWLERFPDELVQKLAAISPQQIESVASAWANTEELNCDPQDLQPVIVDLQQLSKRAINENKAVYLWGCL